MLYCRRDQQDQSAKTQKDARRVGQAVGLLFGLRLEMEPLADVLIVHSPSLPGMVTVCISKNSTYQGSTVLSHLVDPAGDPAVMGSLPEQLPTVTALMKDVIIARGPR